MAPVDRDKLRHHVQSELDPAEVFDIVEKHLADFEAYLAPVVERYF